MLKVRLVAKLFFLNTQFMLISTAIIIVNSIFRMHAYRDKRRNQNNFLSICKKKRWSFFCASVLLFSVLSDQKCYGSKMTGGKCFGKKKFTSTIWIIIKTKAWIKNFHDTQKLSRVLFARVIDKGQPIKVGL